jgi:hypothetical protein
MRGIENANAVSHFFAMPFNALGTAYAYDAYDIAYDIALTFLSPTGKLSIRPFAAFGALDEHGVILRNEAN